MTDPNPTRSPNPAHSRMRDSPSVGFEVGEGPNGYAKGQRESGVPTEAIASSYPFGPVGVAFVLPGTHHVRRPQRRNHGRVRKQIRPSRPLLGNLRVVVVDAEHEPGTSDRREGVLLKRLGESEVAHRLVGGPCERTRPLGLGAGERGKQVSESIREDIPIPAGRSLPGGCRTKQCSKSVKNFPGDLHTSLRSLSGWPRPRHRVKPDSESLTSTSTAACLSLASRHQSTTSTEVAGPSTAGRSPASSPSRTPDGTQSNCTHPVAHERSAQRPGGSAIGSC